ncbi:alpha/beta fold hydrolase [Kitasatospora sp. NBC_01266]|uniref:alpha/beta fold hydrolase n=1 Tax=Kitasatospora sp. NBC_01266 TaxID=2903572 RepID=UPI002E370D2F|nr:alpha/beta hydrolase [Kitasatospora sp. NBC_01266]
MTQFESRGTGTPVVLVPGLAATGEFFAPLARELAAEHRVVTVELPTRGPATVRQAAGQLAGVFDRLDLNGAVLLGWSLGASVAWEYLDRFGNGRVSALVSVEQTPRLTLAPNWPHAAFGGLDAAGVDQLRETIAADQAAFAEQLVRGSFAAGSEPDPALVRALVSEALRWTPQACASLLADAAGQDYRARLAALALPVLLVHGAKSQVYPTAVGPWLADTIPGAELRLLEESGHLPFLEQPRDFVRTVSDFIARSVSHV